MAASPSRRSPTSVTLARGGLTMAVVAPRVVDYYVWGHFDMELADRMLELVERELAQVRGQLTAFHDWSDMTGYETRARLRLTAWVLRYRDRFAGIHILSSSSLVSMGVTVANLALGQFMTSRGLSERADYLRALREACENAAGPISTPSRFPPPRSVPPPNSVPPPRSIPPPNSVPPLRSQK